MKTLSLFRAVIAMGGDKNPYWSSLFNSYDIKEYEFNIKTNSALSWPHKYHHWP